MTAVNQTILAPVTARQITLPSGNCFQIASQYLGDGTQVDRIMALNPQLQGDPWFIGLTTINLPPVQAGAGSGGIIQAAPAPPLVVVPAAVVVVTTPKTIGPGGFVSTFYILGF